MRLDARQDYLKEAKSQFIGLASRMVSSTSLHDEALYERDIERYFVKAWLMIGHESEMTSLAIILYRTPDPTGALYSGQTNMSSDRFTGRVDQPNSNITQNALATEPS